MSSKSRNPKKAFLNDQNPLLITDHRLFPSVFLLSFFPRCHHTRLDLIGHLTRTSPPVAKKGGGGRIPLFCPIATRRCLLGQISPSLPQSWAHGITPIPLPLSSLPPFKGSFPSCWFFGYQGRCELAGSPPPEEKKQSKQGQRSIPSPTVCLPHSAHLILKQNS